VYRKDGALFFTDPPFGLPKFFEDRRKELAFSGVYSLVKGKLRLATQELSGPNGIAFSPDEKHLYVGDWDEKKKVVMRYEARPDGTLANGQVFFDMTSARGEDAVDGIKVDEEICTFLALAVCGYSRRKGSISARSWGRSIRTISRGAMTMGGRCI
jgi:gluconolactonase